MDSKGQYFDGGAATPASGPAPVPRARPNQQQHPASVYPPDTDAHEYEKLQYHAASPADGAPPSYSPPASAPYPTTAAYPAAPGPPQQYPPPPPSNTQYPFQPTQPYPAGYPGYAGTPQYVGSPPPPQPRPQQQQQQQQVVVVSAGPQYQPVAVRHVQSYVGHIVFSCFVFWCCNCLFGLIAFILAVVASSTAVSDPGAARRLGVASLVMSIIGIVISVIIVIAVVAWISVATADAVSSSAYCQYRKYGTCYSYREYIGYESYFYCSGVSYDNYCYYN